MRKWIRMMIPLVTLMISVIGIVAQAAPSGDEDLPKVAVQKEKVTDLQPEGCTQAEVDYDLAPAEVAKRYEWATVSIKDGSFQATPRGKGKAIKEGCWFRFSPGVSSEEAKRRIEASGNFLVGDFWELNAFKMMKPDVQLGLGSVWRSPSGRLVAPAFRGGGLNLYWIENDWLPPDYFLAVRK